MEKQLKDYLHLYLGCQVQYPDTDDKLITAKLTGFSSLDGIETTYKRKRNGVKGDYLAWKENGNHNCNAFNLKPFLRPLSSMIEGEMQECGNMVYDFSNDPDLNKWKPSDFEIGLAPEQFYWLLSKHFDLFGLIDAGLAISKC